MNKQQLVSCCSLLALMGASSPTLANDFGATLAITTEQTDNALKTQDDKIKERQDIIDLGFFAEYENSLIVLDSNYLASMHQFAKDSQEERTTVEGDTRLRFGKENQFADLLLVHSRRSIRSSAEQIDILSNRDERQILSAIPTLRTSLGSNDRVLLQGSFSDIDYRLNEERNAESQGAALIWQRQMSPIQRLDSSVQYSNVTFDAVPGRDYEYQNAAVAYSVTLRQFSYLVEVGYNASKPEQGEDYSSPSFRAELEYAPGFNRFTLFAAQRITDTSAGDSNRGELGGTVPGDVGSENLDQIERRSLELSWQSQMLCERCELSANINSRQDKFLTLENDLEEAGVGLGFSYRFSQAARISINVDRREQRIEDLIIDEKITLDRSNIEFEYDFVSELNARLYVEHEKRTSESELTGYKEMVAGLSLDYRF